MSQDTAKATQVWVDSLSENELSELEIAVKERIRREDIAFSKDYIFHLSQEDVLRYSKLSINQGAFAIKRENPHFSIRRAHRIMLELEKVDSGDSNGT